MEASGYGYGSYCGGGSPQLAMEKQACEQFVVEDLLDFSEDDGFGGGDEVGLDQASADGSMGMTVGSSSNCSFGYGNTHFSGDLGGRSFAEGGLSDELCAPHDEMAELEWLSNFVEESFSNDDIQKLHLISGVIKSPSSSSSGTQSGLSTAQARSSQASSLLRPETHVPGKPRSRRSRAPALTSWSSRLLVLSPPPTCSEAEATPASSRAVFVSKKAPKPGKRDGSDRASAPAADGQKCLHCASEKTPQWRAGPMGPKTLCNACGVRYKSGRLVPEYRPAASPTFVLSEHSNSHRKVLELRRQKEALVLLQQQRSGSGQFMHHSEVYQSPAGGGGGQFLIHRRGGRPADHSQRA